MAARIIDGRGHARRIQEETAAKVKELGGRGEQLHLVAIAVGQTPAVELYSRRQRQACEEIGVGYTLQLLPPDIEETELLGHIRSLNYGPEVTGIILQLPLPAHIDPRVAQAAIDPAKDVEGVSPINLGRLYYEPDVMAPCTATGIVTLLDREGIELQGAEVCLVGASSIVGRPLLQLLLHRMATPSVTHVLTRDLARHTREAEVVVIAAGRPGLLKGEMLRPGATVIDVGINRVPALDAAGRPVTDAEGHPVQHTVGDADFESVAAVAGAITPVPGGVGPMTVATLLANIVRCHGMEKRRWW